MILVTLGSQKFQFNRLLKEMDNLIAYGVIKTEVFAQIGDSDYKPKNYKYVKYLEKELFDEYISKSSLVITHAGTATIITALKAGKKVIAVARLKRHGEHVSDHQLDIVREFSKMKYIVGLEDVSQIANALENIDTYKFENYTSNTSNIIQLIDDYICTQFFYDGK